MNKPMTQSEIESELTASRISTPEQKECAAQKALRRPARRRHPVRRRLFGSDYPVGSRYVTTDNAYVGADTAR